jgi:hypothetical protein
MFYSTIAGPVSVYEEISLINSFSLHNKYKTKTLILQNGILLEKLIAPEIKKCPPIMQPEGSLSCSQKPATGPCPRPDIYIYSTHPPSCF